MPTEDLEDSWDIIERDSGAKSDALADAFMAQLRQRQSRQALQTICDSVSWFSLRAIARVSTRSKHASKVDTNYNHAGVHGALDQSTMDLIEASLASQDAEATKSRLVHHIRTTGQVDMESYSTSATKVLHTVFYEDTLLPCNCPDGNGNYWAASEHTRALRLGGKWIVPGDYSLVLRLDCCNGSGLQVEAYTLPSPTVRVCAFFSSIETESNIFRKQTTVVFQS